MCGFSSKHSVNLVYNVTIALLFLVCPLCHGFAISPLSQLSEASHSVNVKTSYAYPSTFLDTPLFPSASVSTNIISKEGKILTKGGERPQQFWSALYAKNDKEGQEFRAGRSTKNDDKHRRSKWPAAKAFRTFLYFNRPRLSSLLPNLRGRRKNQTMEYSSTSPSSRRRSRRLSKEEKELFMREQAENAPQLIAVTGATGGVGRRVCELLLAENEKQDRVRYRVRALVRNKSKAKAMLFGGKEPILDKDNLEIIECDLSKPKETLPIDVFNGVNAVLACSAAVVMPKEGDTENREKYYQGIKFYEPEVKDSPEEIDFLAIQHVSSKLKESYDKKVLFGTDTPQQIAAWKPWGILDDIVMGGVSESQLELVPGAGENENSVAAVFQGDVSTKTGFASGGFVSARTRNFNPPLDISKYDGIHLRVKGDGNRYKFILRDDEAWDGPSWSNTFDTTEGEWMDIQLPFTDLIPVVRTTTIPISQRRSFASSSVFSFQLMLSKFEYDGKLNPKFKEGQFSLAVRSIGLYSNLNKGEKENETGDSQFDPLLPKFIYLSSAGVTRPGRPGINLDEEPPAVRMNDMLGGILTNKLKGENSVRESGLPYTIIRPCALTEEPRGMPLVVEQGDNIKGKIGRDDVAELMINCLSNPSAANKTFEIKSSLPFSEQWSPSSEQLQMKRDFQILLASLQSDKVKEG